MRILIDTNILINLEDHRIIGKEFSHFYKTAIENQCDVLYHKACLEDINRDKDLERKQIISSKLEKYTPIKNPGKMKKEFSELVGEKSENDRIDNIQLFQLYKGYVELFITNDKGIKKKAKKLGLDQSVLNSSEALTFLEKKYTLYYPTHPILKHESVRKLEPYYDSKFFESLKNDYGNEKFMNWIQKCARQDRKCYFLKVDEDLAALLIYNIEDVQDHELKNINDKAIKICTLKVSDDALGMKLGELFLNKMFQLSFSLKINYLYVTTYEKQNALIHLLTKFGFQLHDSFKNNVGNTENIFIKSLLLKDQTILDNTAMHPFFEENVNKYVIPIQRKYYSSLFKDGNLRTMTLFDDSDYGLQEVQGNTIIKAYISKSPQLQLKTGDLLFFYSSGEYKSIEPLGVLLEHKRIHNIEDLWELVKNKTVYSQEDLEKMFDDRKYLTVTIFRLVDYLKPVIKFDTIKGMVSFKNKFQTITKLKEEDYIQIKKHHINESLIIDKA
ncbi:MAG: hypothetical protein COA32_16475 [Fluviicola sp.]|nr:MAG: hypothetical protein COA32_16475 [Fluviicola sp.]